MGAGRKLWSLGAAAFAAFSLAGPGGAANYDGKTILVKFANPAKAASVVRALKDRPLGLTLNGVEVVGLDKNERVETKVARYRKVPGVLYAEPNFVARAQLAPPNDPQYSSDWAWGVIRAVDGWSVYPASYAKGTAATIGIVDTGVDSAHPDLADGRVLTTLGASCINASGACASSPALDDNGHGTHVAGIAAAATNNAVGVAGTAFGAQIIPVKVLDSTAQGSYAAISNGILWAAQHGARAINLSIGGSSFSQTLCDAVSQAIAGGTVVVASAGNNSSSAANYPAACSGAIGVAATDSGDNAASFSNYGNPDVFLAAPGASIYSTYLNGSYQTMSGTSMAAPFVTGAAALLLGQQPSRTVADVKSVLAQTSDKVGSGYGTDPYGTCSGCTWSSSFGYGRLDIYRALSLTAPAAKGLQIAVTPGSVTTDAAGTAVYSISVTGTNVTDPVDLSVSGLPASAVAVFAPPKTTVPGASRLVVRVPAGTPAGTYTLTFTAQAGSLVSTATATLVVPAGDFSIAVTPGIRYATAGLAAVYELGISSQGGFVGPVDLSVNGLPPGATALLLPPSVPAPGVATLTVQLPPLVALPGTYTLTITGTSGALTHSATATLVVK